MDVKQQKRLKKKPVIEPKASVQVTILASKLGFKVEHGVIVQSVGTQVILPRLESVQNWIREKYNIHIFCMPRINRPDIPVVYVCSVFYANNYKLVTLPKEAKYSEVLDEGLLKVLKILQVSVC